MKTGVVLGLTGLLAVLYESSLVAWFYGWLYEIDHPLIEPGMKNQVNSEKLMSEHPSSQKDAAIGVDVLKTESENPSPMSPDDTPATQKTKQNFPGCDNHLLTNYSSLLILAPHPDDEILGFAGLAKDFVEQGKPVKTVVVTNGDAYCQACTFWKSGSISGQNCDASELAEFGRVRQNESIRAAEILGLPRPEFLNYPDTGIQVALENHRGVKGGALLKHLDCTKGIGNGPSSNLTASSLKHTLHDLLSSMPLDGLVATTHFLDGNGDHAGLGEFVGMINYDLNEPRALALSVIHAHSEKDGVPNDGWYPGPPSKHYPCSFQEGYDQDPSFLKWMRSQRVKPDWPMVLPDDAEYGKPSQLCLPKDMTGDGARSLKARAIEAFGTQFGTVGRAVGLIPEERKGILDCSGYLASFGRKTEVFVSPPTQIKQKGEGKRSWEDKNILEEQYRNGMWSYLDKEASERARHAVIVSVFYNQYGGGAIGPMASTGGFRKDLKPKRILDVGCGVGTLSDYLQGAQRPMYLGVDLSETAIETARKKRCKGGENSGLDGMAPLNNNQFMASDAEKFEPPQEGETYGTIVFSEMLYYTNHRQVFEHFLQYLEPNGIVVMSLSADSDSIIADAKEVFGEMIDEIKVSGVPMTSWGGHVQATWPIVGFRGKKA